MLKLTEEQINEAICSYLNYKADGYAIRIAPSGFFKDGRMRKHRSKYIIKGVSDILYWSKGFFFAFEVKTPTAHKYIKKHGERLRGLSPVKLNKGQIHIVEQIRFLEAIRQQGFVAEFVSSIEDVKTILEC